MKSKFISCVKQQMNMHPSMEPQDIYKLCYQAAFGAEHMLLDEERAWKFLQMEYDQTKASLEVPLFEWISGDVARVNLSAYKEKGLPLKLLFEVFVDGGRSFSGSKETLDRYLDVVADMATDGELNFTMEQWDAFCQSVEEGPVHHSQNYRMKEQPAYRVINGQGVKRISEFIS